MSSELSEAMDKARKEADRVIARMNKPAIHLPGSMGYLESRIAKLESEMKTLKERLKFATWDDDK